MLSGPQEHIIAANGYKASLTALVLQCAIRNDAHMLDKLIA